MAHNTIPEPHADEFTAARLGLRLQAEAHGLDMDCPKVNAFIEHQVEVNAWKASECRWLQSFLNPK